MNNLNPHPDFWCISEALIGNDADIASGQDFHTVADAIADLESVHYAAEHRMECMLDRIIDHPRTAAIAIWMDGFFAGAEYRRVKSNKERRNQ